MKSNLHLTYLLIGIALFSFLLPARSYAATETFVVNVQDEERTKTAPWPGYFWYDPAPPNTVTALCAAASYGSYASNITIERLNGVTFNQRALYSVCNNAVMDIYDISEGDSLRVSLQSLPTGTYCKNYNISVPVNVVPFSSTIGSGTGCVASFVYSTGSSGPLDGGVFTIDFALGSAVSAISSFNVVPNDYSGSSTPGFRVTWGDVTYEDGYVLSWRRVSDGQIGQMVFAKDVTSTEVNEDINIPYAARNPLCDGSSYVFQLRAYNAGSNALSPSITTSCDRPYADPDINSKIALSAANFQSAMNSAFAAIADPRAPATMQITIPVYVPNANATNQVKGKITTKIHISYNGATSGVDYVTTYEDTSFIASAVNNNIVIEIPWPGARVVGESVNISATAELSDPRDDKPVLNDVSTATGVTYTASSLSSTSGNGAPADGLAPNSIAGLVGSRSKTEIGKVSLGGFSNPVFRRNSVVIAGRTYDVKVSLTGSETVPSVTSGRSGVMLALDVSGSMRSEVTMGGAVYKRIDAAKAALRNFINGADPTYKIGLVAFATCFGQWDAKKFPEMVWSYEGSNAAYGGIYTGHAIMLHDLSDSTQRSKIINTIDNLDVSGDLSNLCTNWEPGGATDFGGGITTALASFWKRGYTGTNTAAPFTRSTLFNDSIIRVLNDAVPTGISPYIVLASDGEENSYPKSTDIDIKYGKTPVRNAAENDIPIMTISMGSGSYESVLKNISTQTNGKFFASNSGDGLITAFKQAYDEIQSRSATTKITYVLNTTNFELVKNGANFDYHIMLRKAGESVEKNTGLNCNQLPSSACYVDLSNGTITLDLPFFNQADRYYMYLKVKPKDIAARENDIWVNKLPNNNSFVNFPGTVPADRYDIENVSVDILPQTGFFLAEGGNIYSLRGLISYISEGIDYFATQNEPIIFTDKAPNYAIDIGGATGLSPTEHRVENGQITYDSVIQNARFSTFTTETISSTIVPPAVLGSANDTEIFTYPSNPTNGPIFLPGVPGGNPLARTKVFVSEEDVYITESIAVSPGKLLVVMSRKNVYIDQSVDKLEAIVIADGNLSTYCSHTGPAVNCGKQTASSGGSTTLTLEGMYILHSGITMGRRGNLDAEPAQPGELFVMRPDFLLYAVPYLGMRHSQIVELAR